MDNLSYYLLLLILPVVFFFFFIITLKKQSSSKLNSPPSPPSLPLIGHLHLIKNALHLSLSSLSSQYGPVFSLRLGCKSFVVISSPSAVEECFTTNDVVFSNRPRSMGGDRLTYNYSAYVWSPYGHYWRTLRKLSVIELFSSHSLARSAETREEETRKIIRVLSKNRAQKVDLNYLASVYTVNHMMRGVAGKSCVDEDEMVCETGRGKLEQVRGLFSVSLSQGMCDFFPVLRWIGYKGMEKELISLHNKRDEFSESLIKEVKLKNDDDKTKKSNLIETLLSLQESEPEFYTNDVIKSMILILFIAGTETTAVTIEWAMSLLIAHPDELLKLRREIDDNIGHDHLLNDSDLTKLPYLRSVVNETLRLYPPVPLLLPRSASENCTIEGYNIPKGTILLVNAWAMLRNPKLWDEPDKFNPGRFMGMETEREYKFVPFGMGRRACPGSTMGLRTVSLALGAFVQCFEWEQVVENEVMEDKYKHLMLKKVKPLEAVCVPRHEAAGIITALMKQT
ncbi:hypothetical protein CASFOL_042702 [Castilleja foliolosa]|uniref:Cytochrome P450 n=1 Tax=Castilleja foliolosa TaxID=1961234 RepID=A0ABD3B830_9LAMI